ncbi:hypothetical protein MPSEU_000498700 [Mayamaea pseudoterrestris]|nr:hypothetical protein MPSEU_000498700 [Mayamaea pseudoterrestris]
MSSATTDMSVKVGGRVFHPALPVVDGAFPTKTEQGFQDSLTSFVSANVPLESREGIQTRERVLDSMGVLCRDWIRSVCASKGLAPDVIDMAGGSLYTSGSYRLGVHEPGADIDTILVAPSFCRRTDFFGLNMVSESGARDPNSLAERIRRHPDVENFVAVDTAAVPILTFDWSGVNIDLLFARVNTNSVPPNFDIDNDSVLDGADGATEKSLNGPRVTNLIAKLVSGTPDRYQTFLTVVRCVRKWAKYRGLYSNKMGYWGGVNINIGVALTIQMYPNACAASLLRKFFLVFKTWRWPQPVMLTKPHDAGYGLPVWSLQGAARQIAPMITPAYPAMNSSLSVSRQTLQIMQAEFERGHAIVDSFWKRYNANQVEIDWNSLFAPSDFFISYPHYLSLCIVGPTQNEAQAWCSFVESRLRKLVSDQLGRSLPLKRIQLWPKKIEHCVADKGAILTLAQRQNAVTYFVGFQVDKYRMRGTELNIEGTLQKFREWDLLKFQPLLTGMDILAKVFKVKELPKVCFVDVYESKEAAMRKRRIMLDADPARQERKRKAKLDELKAKMALIQRKKDSENDKKRKQDEIELEEAEVILEANESAVASEAAVNEETNLLESALDNIQDSGETKSREEAEADKKKLLSGDQLEKEVDEEAQGASDDDDYGYTAGRNLLSLMPTRPKRDMRSLPPTEEELEILQTLGYSVVTDDENKVIGASMPGPWCSSGTGGDMAIVGNIKRVRIKFLEPFDVVELDPLGHVIDKGDDDFSPCKNWTGRKAGFEFKLGERGMGYYRTGKPVVVPSNTIY